jgi:nucleotide-binding universal stress UspA family protein
MKLLIPVDGSDASNRAVAHVARRVAACPVPTAEEVHLLNVQVPLRGSVGMFLDGESKQDYYREEGMKALESARKILDAASVKHGIHIEVGKAGEVINRYVSDLGIDEIVMGTRGLGNLADILMGSTSEDVLRTATVPVLLVK